MRQFHVACPYTSLPVCHCHLYAPAAQTRPPLDEPSQLNLTPTGVRKHVRAHRRDEDAKRRAQLLAIWYATAAPAGVSSLPCASSLPLARALYHRAMYAKLPPSRIAKLIVRSNHPKTGLASAVSAQNSSQTVSLPTPSVNARANAALMAAADAADEMEFVRAKDRLDDARRELERADELLSRVQQDLHTSHDSLYIPPVAPHHSNSSPLTPPQSPPKPQQFISSATAIPSDKPKSSSS